MVLLVELEAETAVTMTEVNKLFVDLVGPINESLKGRPVISLGGPPTR